ncbi:pirin family protein [Sphingobacterium sp. UDSM-2020]|uniref:pirin family protein n=1 Tax=Sphingobacterium TaxID=28453 RepID=UPI001937450E|nr:pirin family protein [Sphingobacterium sp. UDSM-2020]QQD13766.1 pirin family protein [Sphingobacterium sp. UDSM-2020]
MKNVEIIAKPQAAHFVGDGFRVHNLIPSIASASRMSPFIMLDYNSTYHFPPSEIPKGVGVHPHRGFETVTIAYKGRVEHGDSSGGGGVIKEGDVQWMTAASGILHKEFHETEWSKTGGDFQMVQLWVNLPAKDKMSTPKYQAIANNEQTKVKLDQGEIEVIAGEYQGNKGPASTFTPMHVMNAKLEAGGKASFSFPAHYNTAMIVIEGNILINGKDKAPTDHFVMFGNEGEEFNVQALDEAVVLIMSGEPILEPIVSHGPFVMNTRAEINQAFEDFQTGKFGYLAD